MDRIEVCNKTFIGKIITKYVEIMDLNCCTKLLHDLIKAKNRYTGKLMLAIAVNLPLPCRIISYL